MPGDDSTALESVRPKTDHEHNTRYRNEAGTKAAQSCIDRNMWEFRRWTTAVLKDTPNINRKQKMLLRAFFAFVAKNLHRALCAETWHYLGELTDKIIALSGSDDANLAELSEKLAAPDTKVRLKEALSLDDEQAAQITAVDIARAFRKMFKVEQSDRILREFRAQIDFVERSLTDLGFP